MIINSFFLRDIKHIVPETFSSLLRIFPEAIEEDQVHGQAQIGLVHHGILGRWNFVSCAGGALFKLGCRVFKGVNLGQVVFLLWALNVLWLKALLDEEVLLFFF